MKSPITARQSEVLRVIRSAIALRGVAPSLHELAEALKISSTRGVVKHLIALQRKGYIYRTSEDRGIELIENESDEFVTIPILGYANAGKPLAVAEENNIGILNVARNLLPNFKKNYFSLIIKGDSMNNKSIDNVVLDEGNYVIIDQSDTELRKNEVYLFIINGGATIKCVEKEGDFYALYPQSSNPIHRPYYIDKNTDVVINGRVIRCLKKPEYST